MAEGWLWDSIFMVTARPAADIDDAGVFLAGLDHDPRAGVGEAAQQRFGVLVAAVLAPEGAEHAKFEGVGLAVEPVDDHLVLGGAEGHLVEHLLGYRHAAPPEALVGLV